MLGLMGRALLPIALGWLVATSLGVAGAAEGTPPEPQRHGAYCTPAGCAGTSRSAQAAAAGFAAAVWASGALARRRSACLR